MSADVPTGTPGTVPVVPVDGWRRALACGPNGGNCVEVNRARAGLVAIRDSKPAIRPELTVDSRGWAAFLGAATGGRFAH